MAMTGILDSLGTLYMPGLPLLADEDDVLLDVPAYQNANWWACGFIAGWMIVKTFHPRQRQGAARRFYDLCGTSQEDGTGTFDLKHALKQFKVGVRHVRKGASYQLVAGNIDAGMPMICHVRLPRPRLGSGHHWCVVCGYNPVREDVIAYGNNGLHGKRFRREKWARMVSGDKETLVCWGT